MKLARDTWLIFDREVRLMLRNPIWLIIGVMQPVWFLLLFGPLLKGIPMFSGDRAYQIFVPALLIQLALFGTFFVGFGLIADLRAGVIERMRVTPVSRLALLLGRAGRDVAGLLVQALVLIALALPFGLSVQAGPLVLTLALLALIGLIMVSISYAFALAVRSEDALAPLLNSVSLPLLLLSGILLPMWLAPNWLQTLAKANPLSHAVDASRALFAGHPGDASVPTALVILVVLAVAATSWAARSFARSVR